MPSLTDKLKALGVKIGTEDLKPTNPSDYFPIERTMPGNYFQTTFGEIFNTEFLFDRGFSHGIVPLNGLIDHDVILQWAGIEKIAGSQDNSIGFIDTETSGLAGGTGNFAFMVGLGYFQQDQFHILQFFMRDPTEEKALLSALEAELAKLHLLVSFNGKSFDIPILKTRYEINQLVSPVQNIPHVDLLHLARRIWKYRLSDRSLKELETAILKLNRTRDEIPGWLIPQMYVDYLRTQDSRPLEGVFYHNRMDVVSLAALFIHLSNFLENPIDKPLSDNLDLFAAAKLFEELGDMDLALKLYENSRMKKLPGDYHSLSLLRNARICIRNKDFSSAIELLEIASKANDLESTIELAKLLEHKVIDIKRSLKLTQKGMRLVARSDLPEYQKKKWMRELDHRSQRLHRKLALKS